MNRFRLLACKSFPVAGLEYIQTNPAARKLGCPEKSVQRRHETDKESIVNPACLPRYFCSATYLASHLVGK